MWHLVGFFFSTYIDDAPTQAYQIQNVRMLSFFFTIVMAFKAETSFEVILE
jgi:hypothetical protein